MEILILIAALFFVLPGGVVLGVWLLRSWWRQRGQPSLPSPAPQADLDALWFGHLREMDVLCHRHDAARFKEQRR